jgi:transcription antitermination factor NusG
MRENRDTNGKRVSHQGEEWFALHVKSRHEFVAQGEMRKKDVESFLPTVARMRQWKDRRKMVEFPLFPGYLFVRTEPNSWRYPEILRSRGVVSFVSLEPGHPASISQMEIESLQILLGSGKELDLYPHMKAGSRVCVRRGALKGACGVLTRKEDQHVFLVKIELLGRIVGVKLLAEELEAA